jgi:hypothetical protein
MIIWKATTLVEITSTWSSETRGYYLRIIFCRKIAYSQNHYDQNHLFHIAWILGDLTPLPSPQNPLEPSQCHSKSLTRFLTQNFLFHHTSESLKIHRDRNLKITLLISESANIFFRNSIAKLKISESAMNRQTLALRWSSSLRSSSLFWLVLFLFASISFF